MASVVVVITTSLVQIGSMGPQIIPANPALAQMRQMREPSGRSKSICRLLRKALPSAPSAKRRQEAMMVARKVFIVAS